MNDGQFGVEVVKNSDVIRISTKQAQSHFNVKVSQRVDKKGNKRNHSSISLNLHKIEDAFISIFQDSNIIKNFNYYKLQEEAKELLEPEFIKHGIVESKAKNNEERLLINKKRKIAIHEQTEKLIESRINLNLMIEDFDEFIKRTGIKSATRIGNALKILHDVQKEGGVYEWSTETILNSPNFSEIDMKYVSVSPIPQITLILSSEIREKYGIKTISQFIANKDIKQKRKYIKGLEVKISPLYAAKKLCIGSSYITRKLSKRHMFNSVYSYRLDNLIKSIYLVQHIKEYNYFTVEELQKILGTQYKEFKTLKLKVLNVALKEIEEFTEFGEVKCVEDRANNTPKGALKGIYFKIKLKQDNTSSQTSIKNSELSFYIASRLYFFDKTANIKNIDAFAKSVENSINTTIPELLVFQDKNIIEWKEEYEIIKKAKNELIQFFNLNDFFLKKEKIKYDEQMFTILKYDEVENKYKLIKYRNNYIKNPIESVEYLYNEYSKYSNETTPDITNFFPFAFATSDGWCNIDSNKMYLKYKDLILDAIYKNKIDSFQFNSIDNEKNPFEEIFKTHLINNNFVQVKQNISSIITKLKEEVR